MGDNDFPAVLGGSSPAAGFLQQYVRGFNAYSQAGTNIPAMSLQNKYAQESGSPFVEKTEISSSPSFDLMGPDIDSPTVDEWIKNLPDKPLPSPEQMKRNIQKIRDQVRPILRGA